MTPEDNRRMREDGRKDNTRRYMCNNKAKDRFHVRDLRPTWAAPKIKTPSHRWEE